MGGGEEREKHREWDKKVADIHKARERDKKEGRDKKKWREREKIYIALSASCSWDIYRYFIYLSEKTKIFLQLIQGTNTISIKR